MKKTTRMLAFISIIASSFSFAGIPATIINNTGMKMDVQFSHCNAGSACTFAQNLHLDSKGNEHNYTNLLYPAGMDAIHITSAKAFDKNNNVFATLSGGCESTSSENKVIVLDTFGTNKIFCFYSRT